MSIAAAVLAAVAVLALPGAPIVLALRLRPLTAFAALAPVSLFCITVSAEAGSRLHVPWSILSPIVLGLLLAVPLAILRPPLARSRTRTRERLARGAHGRHLGPTDHPLLLAVGSRAERDVAARRMSWAILAGLGIGAAWIILWQLRFMGSIHAVSQTYDNVFHLNAIRRVLRFEDASAWIVGGMTQLPGDPSYYPSLWHQATSLVVLTSGQDIVLSSNVLMILAGALVWTLGLLALVRTCTDAGPVGLLLAGALAGISGAFPLAIMHWGILLPYLLAMVMLPLIVLLAVQALRLDPGGPERLGVRQLAVLIPVVGAASALAHPQVVFSAMVLIAPLLVWAAVTRTVAAARREPGATRAAVASVLAAVVILPVGYVMWVRLRPVQSSAVWESYATPKQAIGQALSLSATWAGTWEPIAALLAICTVAVALFSRQRWLAFALIIALAHGAAARTIPLGDLRYLLIGNWYADTNRVTAIAPVLGIPVIALAGDLAVRRVRARWPQARRAIPAAVAAGVVGVLVLAGLSPAQEWLTRASTYSWQSTELLSPDERELLEKLPAVVPPGAVIATNAWNGSSLAYAISDRDVLNTFMGFAAPRNVHLLNAKLDEANTDPTVCAAAHALHVEYALDFGPRELFGNRATYTGLNEISETGAATEVLRVGEASLWKLDPCRGPDGTMLE